MATQHKRRNRLKRLKRDLTTDQVIQMEMSTIRMFLNQKLARVPAKYVAKAVADEFRATGLPRELRRHL